jgi:hypothetical protein
MFTVIVHQLQRKCNVCPKSEYHCLIVRIGVKVLLRWLVSSQRHRTVGLFPGLEFLVNLSAWFHRLWQLRLLSSGARARGCPLPVDRCTMLI